MNDLNVGAYLVKRALLTVVVVIGTITITFFLSHVVPSNPVILLAGQNPTPEQIARLTHEYGLDEPLYVQFLIYLRQVFSGNLGISFSFSLQPVLPLVLQTLPNSMTLGALATLLAIVVGIPLGVESARRTGRKFDSLMRIFSVSSVALPQFWLGLILQLIFAVYLGILPNASYGGSLLFFDMHPVKTVTGSYLIDSLLTGNFVTFVAIAKSMVLPVLTLALYPIGLMIKQTRSSVMAALSQDYIRTARAYGIKEREVNYRFALKNALPPIIVTAALTFAYSSTLGVIYVEEVFNLAPGLGFLLRSSTGTGISSTGISGALDYQLILGLAIVVGIFYAIANLVADALQIYFDRRIAR